MFQTLGGVSGELCDVEFQCQDDLGTSHGATINQGEV